MSNSEVPVITIDGPTASGKGTVAQRVARTLGFHYLDSGALYRLTALLALRKHVPLNDEHALAKLAYSSKAMPDTLPAMVSTAFTKG